ncbi:MAG TPA: oligoendopeptidase F [Symbiobacteriaceae bacterium]|nr:oligoendopeptidase F [Symbiobacteriaceae bacterium]
MTRRPARTEVPAEQTWDLESFYSSIAAWEADLTRVDSLLPALEAYQGRLGESPASLLAFLRESERMQELESNVFTYAFNRWCVDQANPVCLSLRERSIALRGRMAAAISFVNPEILSLPTGTVEAFLHSEPALEPYRLYLTDILAEQEHMLSAEGERVLVSIGELGTAFHAIYQTTTTADMQFDPVADEQGNLVPMSMAALIRLLQSPDRAVRQAAYESSARAHLAHKRTIAATMAGAQKRDVILARLRRYPSALAAALAEAHLPEDLFYNLLRTSEAGAEHLRRYARFRRQALGVERLEPWDLGAPLDQGVETSITFRDACSLVLEALAPLGPAYRAVLETALTSRWIDWADHDGKRAGAYSCHWHGYHPVIMMTWQGKIADVFTLAHELGHAVHAYLSSQTQRYFYSNCSLFIAEMPSTANELLLAHHLLQTSTDRKLRRYVLTRALDAFMGNFWGASIGASLQMGMHEVVERGEALTYELITEMQMNLYRRWYGDTLVITPEGVGNQWLRVPHHFMNFYYYQYATGISAAAAFTAGVLQEDGPAVERYLNFLKSGSSAHPLDLLRAAQVDMTSPEPIDRAIAHFGDLVTQLEEA